MKRLSTRVHQTSNRKLHLLDQRVLLLKAHVVALYQSISEVGDVLIVYAFTVKGIESDPRAGSFVIVSNSEGYIFIVVKIGADLFCRSAVYSAVGGVELTLFIIPLSRLHAVSDYIVGLEECVDVCQQLLFRVPALRRLGNGFFLGE